jgi:Response regulator containing a CheY-like receiver domain and an HTH DNA-binding domain
MIARRHILIATLGSQPQIVTFTLDILLRSYPIEQVIVIHPQPITSRLQYSLACLQAEFSNDRYRPTGQIIHFRSQILQYKGEPLSDITNDQHADGTLDTIHQLITEFKRQDYCIHLSVTGGRRMIGLLATSVASLNFDRYDHIWHLYTPDAIADTALASKCMHVPTDAGTTLIEGPFIRLGNYLPGTSPTFSIARQEGESLLQKQERARCQQVIEQATKAQKEVLKVLSRGLRPQQVADELTLSLSTVNSHKTALLSLCRNAWLLTDQDAPDYHFLDKHFSRYFNSDN